MTVAFTLRAFFSRWRRLLVSAVTVAFGVAIVTGALVFTDTTHAAYERLFSGADGGSSLIVASRQAAGTADASGAEADRTPSAPIVPRSLIRRISALSGVAAAQGQIIGAATIVGADGAPLLSSPQTVAMSVLSAPFSGFHYEQGGPPTTASGVVIDASTARQEHWSIGDEVSVVTAQPAERFEITGIATLGSSGGERFALFTPDEAQRLYLTRDFSEVQIAADPGVKLAQLSAEIARLLPADLVVQSQSTQVALAVSRISTAFSTLSDGLLAFAIVAVLIGALVIFNTFSATATQRQRELALLRALGATRAQILRASLLESVLTGVVGAVVGVAAGPFIALAVRGGFGSAGVGVASGGLTVSARAIGIGLGVGIGVSFLAAMLPALRARRAAPIEALRVSRGADAQRPHPVLWTLARAIVSAGLGAGGLVLTLTATGDQDRRLTLSGVGGGLMLLGALVGGPLVVIVFVWVSGLRRRDPIFGLARDQARVNRGRTALSASSLMIGVALALVITAYASGLRHATSAAIRQTVVGDVVVESQNASAPIPAASVRAIASIPDLSAVSALKTVTARLQGAGSVQIAGVDPTTWPEVYHFDFVAGAPSSLSGLTSGQVLVEQDTARAAHLHVGSEVHVVGPSGEPLTLKVAGIYDDSGLLKGITVPLSFFESEFDQPQLQDVFVKLSGTVSRATAVATLRRALAQFPGVVVRNQRQLASRLASNVTSVVDLLYALLVLAVLMSLLGIGGSLNLGVQTRTGEIGMLRALGMTPRQARSLVRGESLLTAMIGGVSGVGLGLVLSIGVVHALSSEGFVFVFPWPALAGSVLAVVVAGVLAAILPARRAAKVAMLSAIAYSE
jgi:putative ABC transport system permease protein